MKYVCCCGNAWYMWLHTAPTKITSMFQWFDPERAFLIFILDSWRSILISQFYHILKESFLWFELIGPVFCSTFLFFRAFPSLFPLSSSGTKTWTNLLSSTANPMLCFPLMWSFSVSFLLYMYPQRAHRNFTWNQQPFFIWISCLVLQSHYLSAPSRIFKTIMWQISTGNVHWARTIA